MRFPPRRSLPQWGGKKTSPRKTSGGRLLEQARPSLQTTGDKTRKTRSTAEKKSVPTQNEAIKRKLITTKETPEKVKTVTKKAKTVGLDDTLGTYWHSQNNAVDHRASTFSLRMPSERMTNTNPYAKKFNTRSGAQDSSGTGPFRGRRGSGSSNGQNRRVRFATETGDPPPPPPKAVEAGSPPPQQEQPQEPPPQPQEGITPIPPLQQATPAATPAGCSFKVPEVPIVFIKDYGPTRYKYTAKYVFTNGNKIKLTEERARVLYKEWSQQLLNQQHRLLNKLTLAYTNLNKEKGWNFDPATLDLGALLKKQPKRNIKNVRPVQSKPINFKELKDRRIRKSLGSAADAVSKLQNCSTFANYKDAIDNPKCQHFMFSYDELGHNHKLRKDPITVILSPEHVDQEQLGRELCRVGTELFLERSQRVTVTSKPEDYLHLVLGEKKQRKSNGGKKDKSS